MFDVKKTLYSAVQYSRRNGQTFYGRTGKTRGLINFNYFFWFISINSFGDDPFFIMLTIELKKKLQTFLSLVLIVATRPPDAVYGKTVPADVCCCTECIRLEPISKNGFWFKVQSSLCELRPTGKAAANIKPEEYSSISRI